LRLWLRRLTTPAARIITTITTTIIVIITTTTTTTIIITPKTPAAAPTAETSSAVGFRDPRYCRPKGTPLFSRRLAPKIESPPRWLGAGFHCSRWRLPSMSKPVLVLIVLLSTSLWYGLAVLGEGGLSAFFAHPARVALGIVGAVLAGVGLSSEANLRTGEREDRSNRWIFAPLLILTLLSGWLPAWCDRAGFLTLDGDAARWVGVVLFAVGGALRLAPTFVLGRRFSGLVAIQPGHRLVTTGLYGTIRHPSYLGLLVMALGWALAFRSIAGVALALLMLFPLMARMRSEEALLEAHFGDEYAAYRARTSRLIPGIY
jgi:protein-S-isoprenylcysteine O-methyltransferase Ste14